MKNLKNKLKINKGITLIALIITIIVLLILAGITISQLGNSGLFEKAKLAKEESKNAQDYEDSQIDKYSNEIDEYINGNRNVELTDDVKNYIDSKIQNVICLTGTTPSIEAGWGTVFNYPEGFNKDNTLIVGGIVAGGYCFPFYDNNSNYAVSCLSNDGIQIKVSSYFASKTIKLYIRKIEK